MVLAKLRGLVFRATSPRYRDLRRTAEMSRSHPGRFNTPEVGAVYVSREPTTAIEEFRRRATRDGTSLTAMHPRSLFVLQLSLHTMADLTIPRALSTWGLTAGNLESDDFTRCQEVAAVALQHSAEAIQWASATGAGRSLALYVERLLPGSSVELEYEFELSRGILAELETGAALTTVLPDLYTLYPT